MPLPDCMDDKDEEVEEVVGREQDVKQPVLYLLVSNRNAWCE